MAFRKRNIAVGNSSTNLKNDSLSSSSTSQGTKPSSLTSQPITSTGTPSLDALLSGHGGLPLGSSILIEEQSTTDFSGALLRFFAAEGICHGHEVYVVGVGEGWVQSLPGVVEGRSSGDEHAGKESQKGSGEEKMKIAWRYESMGQAAERALPRRTPVVAVQQGQTSSPHHPEEQFCHSFDLSKRLDIPKHAKIHHIAVSTTSTASPFDSILRHLESSLNSSSPNSIHRLIIPTILNPAIYPTHASRPENFVRFLHSLRSLLRQYPKKLTALISLPLALYSKTSSLVRWAEILSDGVLELQPFAHTLTASSAALAETGGARSNEDQPQGLFYVHKLPVTTERGEGGAGVENSIGTDLAFTVSRRKFVIKPFSLPPLEAEQEPQQAQDGAKVKLTGKEVEF